MENKKVVSQETWNQVKGINNLPHKFEVPTPTQSWDNATDTLLQYISSQLNTFGKSSGYVYKTASGYENYHKLVIERVFARLSEKGWNVRLVTSQNGCEYIQVD